jgi:hypothetical protein
VERRHVILVGALALALGCRPPGDPESSASDDDTAGESGEGTGGDDGEGPAVACEASPAPAILRRLTVAEYQASVRDVLGVQTEDLAERFPVDATVHGFSNNASVQSVLLANARAYQDVAEIVASRVVEDAARRDAVVGCTPGAADDDPCLRDFVERLTLAAFRRPVDPAQTEALLGLAASSDGSTPWSGVSLVLRAVLQSPNFVFRIERGTPDIDDPTRRRLDGYEVGARLSYFIWQTTPDAWLLERAAQGELDDADGVADVARQMLDDPRAEEAMVGFATGWLRLSALDDLGRNPQGFPEWSPQLRTSMRQEVVAKVTDATLTEGRLLDLFDGREVWIDANLAELYDLPAPAGGEPSRVVLPDDDDRGGLLGTAAVLALTTPNDVTSPVRRGMFVWEALLCSPLPPPPPGVVGELPPPQELPKADALELHRSDPSCAGCHDLLDPIGVGLERYDALGRRRTLDEGGRPVIERGEVPGLDDGGFGGAGELGAHLAQRPDAHRCVATAVLRWSMGRTETDGDACLLDALQAAVAAGDFAALVDALVRSEAFRTRPAFG